MRRDAADQIPHTCVIRALLSVSNRTQSVLPNTRQNRLISFNITIILSMISILVVTSCYIMSSIAPANTDAANAVISIDDDDVEGDADSSERVRSKVWTLMARHPCGLSAVFCHSQV